MDNPHATDPMILLLKSRLGAIFIDPEVINEVSRLRAGFYEHANRLSIAPFALYDESD